VVTIVSRMNVGGPSVLLKHLIDGLVTNGIDHVLITGKCMPNEIDFLESNSIPGRIIRINRVSRSIGIIKEIIAFVELTSTIRELKPDIVHTHMSKAGLLGRLATRIASPNTQIVHTYHGHLLYGYFNTFKVNLFMMTEKILARISDRLIAVSNQVKIDLSNHGLGSPEKWIVIPPGIPPLARTNNEDARKVLNLPIEKVVIAWIGRFEDVKDPLLAIKSFEIATKANSNRFLLVMAGDGVLRKECQSYVAQNNLNVLFLGWVLDVAQLLNACDFLFLSSKNEGMPIVLLEAASIGKPALSTRVGAIEDFIAQGITGELTSRSAQEIALMIERFDIPENLTFMGLNAHALYEQHFSLNRYILNHLNLYSLLVQPH